jgi:hypothetical protein
LDAASRDDFEYCSSPVLLEVCVAIGNWHFYAVTSARFVMMSVTYRLLNNRPQHPLLLFAKRAMRGHSGYWLRHRWKLSGGQTSAHGALKLAAIPATVAILAVLRGLSDSPWSMRRIRLTFPNK